MRLSYELELFHFMKERLTDSEKYKQLKLYYLKKFRYTCHYCSQKINLQSLHIDHFIPKCKGGLNKEENYVASCKKCNLAKNGKYYEKFIEVIEKRIKEMKPILNYYNKIINTHNKRKND